MTPNAMLTWIVQVVVTWFVFRDLGPQGSRLLARALELQSEYWIWIWLIGTTIISLFVGSRIAANTFAAYTGKRPHQDWYAYGQSGGSTACYWCGLTGFAISLLVASLTVPSISMPGLKAGSVCVLALLVNTVLIRFVLRVLFRRQYGQRGGGQEQNRPVDATARRRNAGGAA